MNRKPKMSVISESNSSVFRSSYGSSPWLKRSAVDDRNTPQQMDSLISHPEKVSSNKSKSIQHSNSMVIVVNNLATWLGVNDKDMGEKRVLEKWKDHVKRRRCNNRLVGQYKDDVGGDDVFDGSSTQITSSVVFKKNASTCHIIDPFSRNIKPSANRQLSKISTASLSRRAARQHNPIRIGAKESVFKMAYNGIKQAVTPSVKQDSANVSYRRSVSMHQIKLDMSHIDSSNLNTTDDVILDDVFFKDSTPTTLFAPSIYHPNQHNPDHPLSNHHINHHNLRQLMLKNQDHFYSNPAVAVNGNHGDSSDGKPNEERSHNPNIVQLQNNNGTNQMDIKRKYPKQTRKPRFPISRSSQQPQSSAPSFVPMHGISSRILSQSNQYRRQVATAHFLAEAECRKSRLDSSIKRQMDELHDHRPYFTCWVTFVQVVCYLFAVSAYDVAPFGLSFTTITEEVLMPNLALEESSYEEENNMWFGLRQADLIHMGAKYSACMRTDDVIMSYVERDRRIERESGCCVRIDRSGCYQTDEDSCSYPFGRASGKSNTVVWRTWRNNTGPYGRSSGPVCQQDPRFCAKPSTPLHQHNWPDDISAWPICEEPYSNSDLPSDIEVDHMNCEVTGRPCCVGVRGQCIITTREDCTFRRGYYHDDLTLCSQVDCLEEICGMVPFIHKNKPDQVYRLFFSLFVHAGVVHLLVTVVFQLTIMRDLEKLAGTLRIGIIYIVSGLGGCLASVIFLPHLVEAGPSGSQFGLLSCLFVEVIQNRYILKQPCLALIKLTGLMLFLFLLGLMPMIDNFAHIFGFLFGFLLSFVLLPYISFNAVDKRNKLILVVTCFVLSLILFIGLLVVFYLGPIYSCSSCHLINCIPITTSFCRNMNLTRAI